MSQISTRYIASNAVTDPKLRQGSATSVIGRSANSTGNVADISASVDGQVLQRSSSALSWATLVNSNISASAAIDFSKLAALTSANILVGNGSNVATSVAVSGDLTLANTGAFTIAKIQGTSISGVTGTGNVVFSSAPTLVNPIVGTQSTTDNSTKAASTAYVTTAITNAIAGVNPAVAVQAVTTLASDTSGLTYNNGVGGIGATLTGTTNTTIIFDGYTLTGLNQRVLVKNDTQSPSGAFNGIYFLSQLQTVGLPPILTRALDYDQPSDINNTGAIPVVNGTLNASTSWLLTSTVNIVGTDPLTYIKFSINPTTILTNTLTSTHIFVGNGSNVATDTAVTGDVTITNAGVTAIGSNKVTNSQLAQMANNTMKANISGSTANPSDVSFVSTATASSGMQRDTNANAQINNLQEGYATTVTAAGTTTLTVSSTKIQYFTGTTTQTLVLPVTSTLVLGHQFLIENRSTGVVTVQSSGTNTIKAMEANSQLLVTVILTTGTTAASWDYAYSIVQGPLPVDDGGTGLSSTTAYAVLAGGTTSTGALQQVSGVGTSGQVLTSNGAGVLPTWQASGGGGSTGNLNAKFSLTGATIPFTCIDGPHYQVSTQSLTAVNISALNSGTSGSTVIQVNQYRSGSLQASATASLSASSGNPAGTAASLSGTLSLLAGDIITVDVNSIAGGNPSELSVEY